MNDYGLSVDNIEDACEKFSSKYNTPDSAVKNAWLKSNKEEEKFRELLDHSISTAGLESIEEFAKSYGVTLRSLNAFLSNREMRLSELAENINKYQVIIFNNIYLFAEQVSEDLNINITLVGIELEKARTMHKEEQTKYLEETFSYYQEMLKYDGKSNRSLGELIEEIGVDSNKIRSAFRNRVSVEEFHKVIKSELNSGNKKFKKSSIF